MSQHEPAFDHQANDVGFINQGQWASARSLYAAENHPSPAERRYLEVATTLLAQRQKRFSYFSNRSIFADPSWDILLFLFISNAAGRTASLGNLSDVANCAQSTALRWLNVLAEEGLIRIVNHSEHLPDICVALSAKGQNSMNRYLGEIDTE